MQRYNNQEQLNNFKEVGFGSITATQAMQKYDVSNSMYYRMKNKLNPSDQKFQEAVILDHSSDNRNSYIIISKNGFKLKFTQSTDIQLLRRLMDVLNDL